MTGRRLRTAVLVTLGLLALGSTASAHPGFEPGPGERDVDLVASAQPSAEDRVVSDEAVHSGRSAGGYVDVDTVATSSATCDGCRGSARAVEVLDARRSRRVHADNVATAWAGCTGCGADAVSVQVVLAGPVPDLRVNNRALAVNGGCVRCDTRAAAYQVVLAAPRWVDAEDLRDGLRAWLASGAAATGPSGGPGRPVGPSLRRSAPSDHAGAKDSLGALEELVEDATGGRVLSGTVRLDGAG